MHESFPGLNLCKYHINKKIYMIKPWLRTNGMTLSRAIRPIRIYWTLLDETNCLIT